MNTEVEDRDALRLALQGETLEVITRNKIIGAQNDIFRTTWGADHTVQGQIVMTPGAAALRDAFFVLIMKTVTGFENFDEENDPYLTRDFGAFEVTIGDQTELFFWKIDLYDTAYVYGSETPEDLTQTRRVMTIMLRSEY